MKLKKIIIIIIPIVLFCNLILYINTFVSEKYETQLEGIRNDITEVEINKRKNKIVKQRNTIIVTSVVLSIAFVVLLLVKKKIKTTLRN